MTTPAQHHRAAAANLPAERAARIYFDYALTGMLEGDPQGTIWRANPAAASITGHDRKALAGLELAALASPDAAPQLQRHLALLREQGISQVEFPMLRRDGREIIVTMSSIEIDDAHFLHVFDDVSEQRRVEAEIRAARHLAEEASQAKSEFLANVSHELRTPLNGILGLSQLALLGDPDPQQRKYLETIGQSGKRLLRIINDLLDSAKVEAGQMEFEHLPFSLDELLDELATLRTQIPAGKVLELGFHVAPEVPRQLLGDRLRLGQCLTNLLANALKFTPAGRVDLQVDTLEIDGQRRLRLCLSDTGIGIAADILPRLFAPFTQADASTTRRFGGSGLGLHITREMARGMGGELAVDSTPGVGSRFTLTLPLQTRAADASGPPREDRSVADTAWVPDEFRGRHLLVVEDDPVNQIVLVDWLARAGIATSLAHNGAEALARVQYEPPPDLLLMDVQMPVMDGLEATRALRARGITLPIVGLSAGASRAEQAACSAAGMSDFLPKPIDIDELWGCLTRWLPPAISNTWIREVAEATAARFLGDSGALQRARAAFLAGHGDDASQLRALLAAGDTAAAGRLAHALKGSAATLGYDELAGLAHQLEDLLARSGAGSEAEALCVRVGQALAQLITGAQDGLAQDSDQP